MTHDQDHTDSPIAPFMPKNPVMAVMWVGSIQYALSQPDILDAFREETGNQWRPPKNALEKMIDDSCGHDGAPEFFAQFAKWHNENIWGEENGRVYDVE